MSVPRPPAPPAEPVPVDGQARVALAHACVQALADAAAVDVLHVKGPALDRSLRGDFRPSSDADVLVRPDHVGRLLEALHRTGWRLVTDFPNGSAFAHAANYHHPDWGYVDVHRSFPGISLAPPAAFAALWERRTTTEVAHLPCTVPDVLDQALLLCLHAARGFGDDRARDDLDRAWYAAPADVRAELRARADDLGAVVALAAALDELDDLGAGLDARQRRTVDLWRFYSHGGSRLDEWRARLRAAPNRRARLGVALRGVGVNREFAAMALGHEPSRRELVGLFAGRVGTAARLLAGRRPRDDAG